MNGGEEIAAEKDQPPSTSVVVRVSRQFRQADPADRGQHSWGGEDRFPLAAFGLDLTDPYFAPTHRKSVPK